MSNSRNTWGPSESAKLDALKDLIEDLSGSFIIFTCFRKFLKYVKELLDNMGISTLKLSVVSPVGREQKLRKH